MDAFIVGAWIGALVMTTLIPALIGGFFRRVAPPNSAATGIAWVIAGVIGAAGIVGGSGAPYIFSLILLGLLTRARYTAWEKRGRSAFSGPPPLPLSKEQHFLRRLNGWQRLFCVVSLFLIISALTLGVAIKPAAYESARYPGNCYETFGYKSFTPKEAHAIVQRTDQVIPAGCAGELWNLSSGYTYKQERAEWLGALWKGAGILSLLLAFIYAIGYAAGWIWQGFFPKKSA